MKLYMAVTKDKYELPYAVEQSATELANRIGVRADSIIRNICRGNKGFEVVEIEVEDGELIEQRTCEMCGRVLEDQDAPNRKYCYACGKARQKYGKR